MPAFGHLLREALTATSSHDPNFAPANNWRLKLALFLNFLILAILLNSVGAVALHVQRAYGVTESSAGLLAVFKSVGIVAASFFAGLYLARIGYRKAMLVALGGLACVCLLVPSVPDFAMIKLLFVAAGAAFAIIKVSVYATVGLVTTDRKSHAGFMSFLESFFTAGIVVGYFLFGAFTDDAHPESTGWLNVFYVLAAMSFIALLLLWSAPLDESRVRSAQAEPGGGPASDAMRPTLKGVVFTFGVCVFLYVMIEQSTMNWLPTFNSKVLHLPARLSLQLASGFTIAMVLGRLLAGAVLRRVSWFPVLAICLFVSAGLVVAALTLTQNTPASGVAGWSNASLGALVFPLLGFFIAPIYPAINSVVLSAVPVQQQGVISSMGVIFSAFGSSIGTLVVGYLFETRGGHAAFYYMSLPLVALLAGLWRLDRYSRLSC